MKFDRKYIEISHYLLKKVLGTSFPNPPVVCLVVESDKDFRRHKIISFGITALTGRPHAEAIALKGLKLSEDKMYSLYTTLEPCCHHGRDKSCVSKILKKKINRIVCSLKDPDSRMNGKGLTILRNNGLEVINGVLEKEIKDFYEGYFINRKHNRPKVTLKIGCSLDGKITFRSNQRSQITNGLSKKLVHIYRSECDAVLIGSNTIKVDNPKLNCRIRGLEKYSPYRIILSKSLDFNLSSEIFKNCKRSLTIVFTKRNKNIKIKRLIDKGVKIFMLEEKNYNLSFILKKLAEMGVCNLLVEGGSKVFTSFIKESLVDQILIFRSNFFVGPTGLDILVQSAYNHIEKKFYLKKLDYVDNNILEIFDKRKL